MPKSKLYMLLGDIIEIIAPNNDTIHKQIFMINYIDDSVIKIVNEKQKLVLNVENETLCDKSIEKIHILDRHAETGYAKQNNLIPGKWIDIHFNTDVPVIITGEINHISTKI